jgi:hypothetical protein
MIAIARRTEGTTILITGIPDVCRKGSTRVDARGLAEYRKHINEFQNSKGDSVLATFYPPAYLSRDCYKTIDDINEKIVRANRYRREVTPRLGEMVFHPQKLGHELDSFKLVDGVHPNRRLAHDIEKMLEEWRLRREAKVKARRELKTREEQMETNKKKGRKTMC